MANERVLRALLRLGIDKKSITEVQKGIKSVEDALEDVEDTAGKSFDGASKAGGKFSTVITGAVIGGVMALTNALLGMAQQGIEAFKQMGKEAVDVNKQFETLITQFTTLLQGDQAGAQNLISQLQQFNIETPFELDQLAEGAKLLQTFGGEALNTAENWKLVGDAAASVNQPFERAAFWIGRLYSNLQAGRPFGEAAMSLQEMGIMSGELRTKLEDMQKAGASSVEVWQTFNAEISEQFTGGAERLSKTLTGIESNLADVRTELLRTAGEPYFEQLKGEGQELLDILSDPEVNTALRELAESLGIVAANLRDMVTSGAIEALANLDTTAVERLAGSLQDAAESASNLSSASSDTQSDLGIFLEIGTSLLDSLTFISNSMNELSEETGELGIVFRSASAGVGQMWEMLQLIINPIKPLTLAWRELNDELERTTGYRVADWLRETTDATSAQTEAQEALREQYAELNQARAAGIAKMQRGKEKAAADALKEEAAAAEEAKAAQEEYADALEKVNDALIDAAIRNRRQEQEAEIDLTRELIDLTEEFAQKRIEAEEDYRQERFDTVEDANQELMEIERDYILDVLDAEERFSQQRQDIAEKNAQSIEDIYRRNQERISDAAQDLAEGRADVERDFQRDIVDVDRELAQERIDVETNYQREIQRIKQQFSQTAEEAVRNQDAIGFLRAKRQQEQALQEAKQNRDENLQDAAVNAERRREELQIQRQRELEDERIANQRKMEELRQQLERELEAQRIQHQRELEQQQQEEQRKLEQLAQAKDREIQQANQKTAQKLQDLAEEYSQEQALIDEQEAQKREKIEQAHARELEDLNRHYDQRKDDIRRNLRDELNIIQNYANQVRQAMQSIRNSTASGGAGRGGPSGIGIGVGTGGGARPLRFASGGYVGHGLVEVGERGKEFIMSNPTTQQLERSFGTLSQAKMQRIGDMAMSNTFNFAERDDARQILGQVEQIVSSQMARLERGY